MKKTRILTLCECAILLALSIVLSFVTIWKMPMGGSITLLSMLPVMLVGVKHGLKWGLATGGVFAAFQLVQGIASGEVFVYCTTWVTVLLVAAFDYILPFASLGLTGLTSSKNGKFNLIVTNVVFALLIAFRFVCHFITGFTIWGQWAPEGMGKFGYSLLYNGGYLSIELILTVAVSLLLLSRKEMRKILGLKKIEVKID
jgi:thiamine transporter